MSVAMKRQRGVALITVLLVFALATLIASEIVSRNYLDIRRSSNQIDSRQAFYYALAGEEYARQLLYRDFTADKAGTAKDFLNETWSQPIKPFDIGDGHLTVRIEDLNRRFNINNIVDPISKAPNSQQLGYFRKLLTELGVSPEVEQRVADWLDGDKTGSFEDSYYQAVKPFYLAANGHLTDISELRLISGIDQETYQKLKPYVTAITALPGKSTTTVNINTAKEAVLEAVLGNSTYVTAVVREQQASGYNALPSFATAGAAAGAMAVVSEYFMVEVEAVYAERVSRLHTVVHRDPGSGKITVITRQQGLDIEPT